MKIIDLSSTISPEVKEPMPTTIVYEDHKQEAQKIASVLFKGVPADAFPDGNGSSQNRSVG